MSRDDEQVWAELVETFHASADDTRRWPDAENVDSEGTPVERATDGTSTPPPRAPDDHFVPPPPPPIPRADLITRLAWVGVLGTPIFFFIAILLGRPVPEWLAALGAGAFIGGFALLVTRLRGHDPYDPDDGAVV